MKLKTFEYSVDLRELNRNPWSIKGVALRDQNLIVGMNSVGKTRLLNLIYNFSQMISGKRAMSPGNWDLSFDRGNEVLHYQLKIAINRTVIEERLTLNGEPKLSRNTELTELYSETAKNFTKIQPPSDKTVMQARTDELEYPFFVSLSKWADSTWRFNFTDVDSSNVVGVLNTIEAPESLLGNGGLRMAGSLLPSLGEDSVGQIVKDMNKVGFKLDTVALMMRPEFGLDLKMLNIGEDGLAFPIAQVELSTGLLRALSLLIVVEYLLSARKDAENLVIIDDLDEGLDYDRANKLSKLLFQKLSGSNIQLIAATNSRVLMNGVDIEQWNILSRKKGLVKAINYNNAKKAFDEFRLTGLSNFDLFSSDFLEN